MSADIGDAWAVPTRDVTLGGQVVSLKRMTVGQHLRLAPLLKGKALGPLLAMMVPAPVAEGEPAPASESLMPRVLELLATEGEWLLKVIAIAAGVDEKILADGGPDELLAVAGGLIELNLDFFIQRMAPAMASAADSLSQRLAIGAGSTPSKP